MSIYISFDSGLPDMLASNKGWGELCRWVAALPVEGHAELKHLCEHGWSEDLPAVEQGLKAALAKPPENADVLNTARTFQQMLHHRGLTEVVTINNGMEPV